MTGTISVRDRQLPASRRPVFRRLATMKLHIWLFGRLIFSNVLMGELGGWFWRGGVICEVLVLIHLPIQSAVPLCAAGATRYLSILLCLHGSLGKEWQACILTHVLGVCHSRCCRLHRENWPVRHTLHTLHTLHTDLHTLHTLHYRQHSAGLRQKVTRLCVTKWIYSGLLPWKYAVKLFQHCYFVSPLQYTRLLLSEVIYWTKNTEEHGHQTVRWLVSRGGTIFSSAWKKMLIANSK